MEGQSLLRWEKVVHFLVSLTQRLPSDARSSIKVFAVRADNRVGICTSFCCSQLVTVDDLLVAGKIKCHPVSGKAKGILRHDSMGFLKLVRQ